MSPLPPSPRPRRRPSRALWAIALVLALVVHAVAVFVFANGDEIAARLGLLDRNVRPKHPPTSVAFRPLTPEQWARNRGVSDVRPQPPSKAAAKPQPTEEKPPEKKEEEVKGGQIVRVQPGNDQAPDPDSKYLAESNNRVEKETRAREQTADYRNAAPQRSSPNPSRPSPSPNGQEGQGGNLGSANDPRVAQEARRPQRTELPDVKAQQEIALRDPRSPGPGASVRNQREKAPLKGNSDHLRIDPGADGPEQEASEGRAGRAGGLQLTPSDETLAKVVGAAPNDSLEDVEEGQGTFLNTRQFKYATYYTQVAEAVFSKFDSDAFIREYVRRDPTGQIYGGRLLKSFVVLTIDAKGNVQGSEIALQSVLGFFDLALKRAADRVSRVGPPPAGLLAGEATVEIPVGISTLLGRRSSFTITYEERGNGAIPPDWGLPRR